jgi:hypothetical protein
MTGENGFHRSVSDLYRSNGAVVPVNGDLPPEDTRVLNTIPRSSRGTNAAASVATLSTPKFDPRDVDIAEQLADYLEGRGYIGHPATIDSMLADGCHPTMIVHTLVAQQDKGEWP